jgi:hypothetical protein
LTGLLAVMRVARSTSACGAVDTVTNALYETSNPRSNHNCTSIISAEETFSPYFRCESEHLRL